MARHGDATPSPHRLTARLLAVLAVVAATTALSTDMYLSSFTAIATDLYASGAAVQLTLTAFFVGVGVGQLLLGPFSDRWGRRPVLLAALIVFTAASVAMVFAPTIEVLIALRLVQGVASAAGAVVSRAIAADLSTGQTAVRALSLIALGGAFGPLVAPPLGALVAGWWGWRGVLAVLAATGILMVAMATIAVPESLPPERRHGGGVVAAFARFGPLLRMPRFTGLILAYALGFATFIGYIAGSPFVGQLVLGMTPLGYALAYSLSGTALITANLVNARVAPRVGPRLMLRLGLVVMVGASTVLLLLAATGALAVWSFIACAFCVVGSNGLVLANGSALALAETDTGSRGAGSALLGAAQFALAGFASPLVGIAGEHTAVPMAVAMTAASGLACLLGMLATRRA
ncbi:multidrug effflux MFS transporter [Microbacterium sp.]|uniref:multidrug effflux MFS transporter n=1 Tax=Microbacterium sp. TaxID=51671 RepID=UPI0039E61B99